MTVFEAAAQGADIGGDPPCGAAINFGDGEWPRSSRLAETVRQHEDTRRSILQPEAQIAVVEGLALVAPPLDMDDFNLSAQLRLQRLGGGDQTLNVKSRPDDGVHFLGVRIDGPGRHH